MVRGGGNNTEPMIYEWLDQVIIRLTKCVILKCEIIDCPLRHPKIYTFLNVANVVVLCLFSGGVKSIWGEINVG